MKAAATARRAWSAAAAAALLALAACGPGVDQNRSNAAPVQPESRAPAPAAPAPAPAPAAPAPRPANAAAPARRCGWLHNPTPGNWWLQDRAGQWVLAVQGGRQAAGMDELPDMSGAGWQEVNGHYGYGCACLTVTADPVTREVAAVADAQPRPLAACRADKSLPRP
ncbi:MAG TPA: DUF4087 domain-containing protein [Allosphingosinicella sp.]|jgi:hypothetical protein